MQNHMKLKKHWLVFTILFVMAVLMFDGGCTVKTPDEIRPTDALILTPTPELGVGSTWERPADGMVMVYVPAGEFNMGMNADDALLECQKYRSDCVRDHYTDEGPVHTIYLDAFWIDQTEVSTSMYSICVQDGACQPPNETGSFTRSTYYGDDQFADYPVIYASWNNARDYCEWAGARLPTEAEWEKAARGMDERVYPWGNDPPNCSLVNFNAFNLDRCVGDTSRVGSYPVGASPYGALDMAGNVWEWVGDWYGDTYYSQSPDSNPQGPENGIVRVLRGGSRSDYEDDIRTTNRNLYYPEGAFDTFGFRCAYSVESP